MNEIFNAFAYIDPIHLGICDVEVTAIVSKIILQTITFNF